MENAKKEDLKKCPFCGGKASLIETLCIDNNYKGYFVHHCCDITVAPIYTSSFPTEERAIAAWNRRVNDEKL